MVIGRNIRRVMALLTLACLSAALSFAGQAQSAQPTQTSQLPDWTQARDECIRLLGDLIRIDTSNPPGNETKAAAYIKAVLDKEGIGAKIFELEPGRGNVVARLKGSGAKKPILLMGHLDVVGVERAQWTVEPFAGAIKDGYIYGRGAADNKGRAAGYLEVLLLLHRLKIPLDRDVIYLAQAGEESTPRVGIEFMVSQHWDEIACEFALDEGGIMRQQNGRIQYVGIATTEKSPRGAKLIARGTPGHGSRPRPDNAITHLAAAVAKVGAHQLPMRLNETTAAFFKGMAARVSPEEAALFAQLTDPKETARVQEVFRQKYLGYNSMIRTSISPTIIKGGFRTNVIPGEAEASLDIRVLPDEDLDALEAALKSVIDDPAVEVVLTKKGRPISPPSRADSDMFRALERAQAAVFPESVTLPLQLSGATDMAQLRAKGVQAYGLGQVMTEDDSDRIHGNDERVSVAGMGQFIEYVYRAVEDVAKVK